MLTTPPTTLMAATYSYRPVELRAVEPCPVAPSPYATVLVPLMSASCIWITRSRSPGAMAGVAPAILGPTEIEVAPAAALAVAG